MKPKLAVIDYGMGNLRSVVKAWQHSGADAYLIDAPDQAKQADALIFPGQGCMTDTMVLLKETGFDRCIKNWVEADKPFFGICLGLQALFEYSAEGETPCLNLFKGEVKRFDLAKGFKIPHMGWNAVSWNKQVAANKGMPKKDDQFYFVHSYRAEGVNPDEVWGTTEYGGDNFCCAIQRGNCHATQFHPEKSQEVGLKLYKNFVESL